MNAKLVCVDGPLDGTFQSVADPSSHWHIVISSDFDARSWRYDTRDVEFRGNEIRVFALVDAKDSEVVRGLERLLG